MQRGNDIRKWAAAGLAGVLAWGVLAWWHPSNDVRYSVCLTRRVLDLPCPGCGFTRASAHLAKGEWAQALRMHPLAAVVAVQGIFIWLGWGALLLSGRKAPLGWVNPWLLSQAALFIGLWIFRWASGTLPP